MHWGYFSKLLKPQVEVNSGDFVTIEVLTHHANDDAEQAAIRKRAMAAIGSIRSGDPTRSARASELVREIIARKHAKESRAFGRTARRTASRAH